MIIRTVHPGAFSEKMQCPMQKKVSVSKPLVIVFNILLAMLGTKTSDQRAAN